LVNFLLRQQIRLLVVPILEKLQNGRIIFSLAKNVTGIASLLKQKQAKICLIEKIHL
jgi:hypothetical protein